jgi:2-methylisocitrate lyase-like PEP mutase family enzyme
VVRQPLTTLSNTEGRAISRVANGVQNVQAVQMVQNVLNDWNTLNELNGFAGKAAKPARFEAYSSICSVSRLFLGPCIIEAGNQERETFIDEGQAMTPRPVFRELLKRDRLLIAPGCFDGLSARLVQEAGFEAAYLSGGAVARSMGIPDIGLVTMSESLERAAQVVAAVAVPVIADADTGYGNAINLVRTVRELERTGVTAIHIEDQITPKRCGHLDGKEVITLMEMENKLRAALAARTDPDFCIIARTDARGVLGFDEAIKRGRAFAELGVDAVFIEAPQSEAELERIPKLLAGVPLLVNVFKGGKTPMLPAARLEQMGYRIAIYPSETQRAAIHAMRSVLGLLRKDGTTEAMDENLTSFTERDQVVGLDEWQSLERRYLATNDK